MGFVQSTNKERALPVRIFVRPGYEAASTAWTLTIDNAIVALAGLDAFGHAVPVSESNATCFVDRNHVIG